MIDLHTHTKHSDGSTTTEELLKEAEKKGIKILSITDHDTIEAYNDLKDYGTRTLFTGKIITGIEITTTYKGEIIEILGYNFDIKKMQELLKQNVLTYEQKQIQEFELMKKQYYKKGVTFEEENIIFNPKIESCRTAFANEIKRYPENRKFFLHESSLTTNTGFARKEIFNPKSPLYVDMSHMFPSLEKTIDMIHEANGFAFLAHVYAYSPTISKELINIIRNYDLDGLECFYTTFSSEQSRYLVDLCIERNMYMCGGSDFHGINKTNHNIGTGNNNLNIDEIIVSTWLT